MSYELDDDMREFLIRHKAELQRNDLNAVYTDILDEFGNVYMPEFTKFFLSKCINPLKYFSKTIPQACFYEIPDIGERLEIKPGTTDIGFSAFLKCNSLKEVSFPSSLEYIGNKAFYNCMHLEKVYFRSELTGMGSNVFGYCPRLSDIYVPWSQDSDADIESLALFGIYPDTKIHYNSHK